MKKDAVLKEILTDEDVCTNINKAIDQYRYENDLKDKDIAEALGMSKAVFSKKRQGRSQFSLSELKSLSDYIGVSCDALLTIPSGSKKKDSDPQKALAFRLPLTEDTLKYITDMQTDFPQGFNMLNLILENKNQICERLLRILLYYSYETMIRASEPSGAETIINPDSSKRMIKGLALSDISFLMDDISKIWNSEYYEKDKRLEKEMRKKCEPASGKRRLRAKTNMKRGQINTIEFINIVEQLSSQDSSYLNPWGYDDKYDFEEYKEEDDNTVVQIIQKSEQTPVHANISLEKTEDASTTTV